MWHVCVLVLVLAVLEEGCGLKLGGLSGVRDATPEVKAIAFAVSHHHHAVIIHLN